MNLHFLATLSSDREHLYGTQFLSSFFKNSLACKVTLFHINRLDSEDNSKSLLKIWEVQDSSVEGNLTHGARQAFDRAAVILKNGNITTQRLITKTVNERYGKVRDILLEGRNGLYDAIILGRRATYALQWFFEKPADEIPQAILKDSSLTNPLWVCCEPEQGRKNILLCVDGSEASFRAADHVGYILKRADEHKVTVFHIRASTSQDCSSESILNKAISILEENGVTANRISSKATWGLSIVNTILDEKNRGKYAAIAVGIRGNNNKTLKKFGIMGGTTSSLIQNINKATVLCCP